MILLSVNCKTLSGGLAYVLFKNSRSEVCSCVLMIQFVPLKYVCVHIKVYV